MIKVLGRKQRIAYSDWVDARNRIEELVTRAEVNEMLERTISEIRSTTKGKHVAFSWSGGKDSVVLADVCKKAGVNESMFAHTRLEYPAFIAWCNTHKPEGCTTIDLGYDLEWLKDHPRMLFPQGSDVQRWMIMCQRKAFTEFFFGRKIDMLLVGHRKADGNVVGENNVLKKNSGEVRYSPLADWPHEMLLAYIHYFKLPLPPIYEWKDGYRQGTHSWAARVNMKSWKQGFSEVYDIDPNIIFEAAQVLPSAKVFIEEENKCRLNV